MTMTESNRGQIYESHHTLFPKEVNQLDVSLQKDFAMDFRTVLSPIVGPRHNPTPERIRMMLAGAFDQLTNTIYLYPELKDAFARLFTTHPSAAEAIVPALADSTKRFIERYPTMPKDTKQSYQSIVAAAQLYEVDKSQLPQVVKAISLSKGPDIRWTEYMIHVFVPLATRFPALQQAFMEITRSVAYHEAAHAWVNTLIPKHLKGTDADHQFLDRIVKNFRRTLKLMDVPHAVLHKMNDEEATYSLRMHSVDKVRFAYRSVKDVHMRKRLLCDALYAGLSEDASRAITIWKTGEKTELYSRQTLLSYFSRLETIAHGGNDGIEKMRGILEKSGMHGLTAHLKEEITRLEHLADAILIEIPLPEAHPTSQTADWAKKLQNQHRKAT